MSLFDRLVLQALQIRPELTAVKAGANDVCAGNVCKRHAKWNACQCDTFMYRLFCEEEPEWTELITLANLMDSKPWWVVTPTQE